MKKLLILLVFVLAGCGNKISDDSPIHSIEQSSHSGYKYEIKIYGPTEPVRILTNKECTIGKSFWECK